MNFLGRVSCKCARRLAEGGGAVLGSGARGSWKLEVGQRQRRHAARGCGHCTLGELSTGSARLVSGGWRGTGSLAPHQSHIRRVGFVQRISHSLSSLTRVSASGNKAAPTKESDSIDTSPITPWPHIAHQKRKSIGCRVTFALRRRIPPTPLNHDKRS